MDCKEEDSRAESDGLGQCHCEDVERGGRDDVAQSEGKALPQRPRPEEGREVKTYYCTVEAAKRAGINRTTLERWQREKRFTPSVLIHTGGKHLYSGWSLEDIERVEAFKG